MRKLTLLILAATILLACGERPKKVVDTPTRGSITVAVDETFFPLIEGEVEVFLSQYKYAHIDVIACPEQEISALLRGDSLRLAVLSRELDPAEQAWFESKKIIPRTTEIARDGIALVVNKAFPDSVITADALKALLRGEGGRGARTLVFDNPASGTVRYMKAFAGVDSLPGAYSMRSNREVLEYVASNPNAIGFTGVDWLYEADSTDKQYIEKIKVLGLGDNASGYFRPTQYDVAQGRYMLTRNIYFINCEGSAGLGLGLAAFLAGDVGQRIVLKAGLLPVTYPKREIVVRNKL